MRARKRRCLTGSLGLPPPTRCCLDLAESVGHGHRHDLSRVVGAVVVLSTPAGVRGVGTGWRSPVGRSDIVGPALRRKPGAGHECGRSRIPCGWAPTARCVRDTDRDTPAPGGQSGGRCYPGSSDRAVQRRAPCKSCSGTGLLFTESKRLPVAGLANSSALTSSMPRQSPPVRLRSQSWISPITRSTNGAAWSCRGVGGSGADTEGHGAGGCAHLALDVGKQARSRRHRPPSGPWSPSAAPLQPPAP